jgi:hypothetical protein
LKSKHDWQVKGKIEYYDLENWWLTTFTEAEREYVDNRYQPMNQSPHTLTQGNYAKRDGEIIDAALFLNGLATWFRNKNDSSIQKRIHNKIDELGKHKPIEKPGYINGRHFVTYVNDVKEIKKVGNLDDAEKLLLRIIVVMEKLSKENNEGVGPWYYEELAKIYRKRREYDKEVTILKRFSHQKQARGAGPKKLLDRLDKANTLADNNKK